MRVKLTVGLSGPTVDLQPGDEYDCSAEEAARLIQAGFAVSLAPKVERAVKPKFKVETR